MYKEVSALERHIPAVREKMHESQQTKIENVHIA